MYRFFSYLLLLTLLAPAALAQTTMTTAVKQTPGKAPVASTRTKTVATPAMNSSTSTTKAAGTTTRTTTRTKADGSPDRRYKENKVTTSSVTTGPVKKDGTADMRYKANKSVQTTKTTVKQ